MEILLGHPSSRPGLFSSRFRCRSKLSDSPGVVYETFEVPRPVHYDTRVKIRRYCFDVRKAVPSRRESAMAIESPKYRVLERDGRFEVREYDSYITASVVIDASYGEALNSGFRILANYIFGNNRSRAHIAMTAPVTGQAVKSENIKMTAPVMTAVVERGTKYRVSFPMPGKYALDTLPLPTDEQVTIEEVKSQRMASLAFRGYLSERAEE